MTSIPSLPVWPSKNNSPKILVAMETLLHISTLNLHLAALHKMALQLHIIVSIFISRNFSVYCPSASRGHCGSWYKECLRPLEAWPHWPGVVCIVPTGNDSLQIQIRSTVVLATSSNTLRPSCRLLSGSVDILKDHVLYGRIFQWEPLVLGGFVQRAGLTPLTRYY